MKDCRVTLRLPPDVKAAIDAELKTRNKGKRAAARMSFNDWQVQASRNKLERPEVVAINSNLELPEVEPYTVTIETGPAWVAGRERSEYRTPAEVAAAIPGVRVGIEEEEGW